MEPAVDGTSHGLGGRDRLGVSLPMADGSAILAACESQALAA